MCEVLFQVLGKPNSSLTFLELTYILLIVRNRKQMAVGKMHLAICEKKVFRTKALAVW